jgi:hypothetical protein
MTRPNFFIVGAPKCGTTSLSEYLRVHPNIFMCLPKEPFFFAEDFPRHSVVKNVKQYLELFAQSTPNHLAIGEASAIYLYSSVAIKNIYQFSPNAKIIIMLRNPVEMIYSYHSQAVYDGNEDEKDFETAWELQALRKKGINIPQLCREPKMLQYAALAKFGNQIEKLLAIFPYQQLHVIWYEDFASSTQLVYENVLSFLGVPSDRRIEFSRINTNKIHKLSWLGKFSEKPPQILVKTAMNTKQILGLKRLGILDGIREVNRKVIDRKPLRDNFRSKLIYEFKDDVEKLSHIFNKDLSHWLV